jgi:hypothetical protein
MIITFFSLKYEFVFIQINNAIQFYIAYTFCISLKYYLVAKKERTLWCNKQELFYLCLGIYSNGQYIYAKLIGIYLFSHEFSRDYLNEIKHI